MREQVIGRFDEHLFLLPPNAWFQDLVVVSFDPDDPLDAEKKAEFLAAHGQDASEILMVGPFRGKLANGGERIALADVADAHRHMEANANVGKILRRELREEAQAKS